MSLATTLSAAILDTILARLAALFLIGANGDNTAARHAAVQMLAAYHPETEDELRLAANIVCFSFQALEALAQAATPDMPLEHFHPDCAGRKCSNSLFDRMIHAL